MRLFTKYFKLFFLSLLIFYSSCGTEEPCERFDVSIEVMDSRVGRQEGSINIVAGVVNRYEYMWSTGAITEEIDELESGDYCVTITSKSNSSCDTVICKTINSFEAVGGLSTDDRVTKVLLIGNSHTFYHQLPSMVQEILASKSSSESVIIESSTRGGFKLQDHAEREETAQQIKSANWDFVVLQENATTASVNRSRAAFAINPFAEDLKAKIVDNNSETKIILYMTHAYDDGAVECESDPVTCSRELMQEEIRRNYIELGDLLSAEVAPAGIMWKIILSNDLALELWDLDKIHPSKQGSLVSAATLAATISKNRLQIENLDDTILGVEETELVVDIINKSLFDNDPDWRGF